MRLLGKKIRTMWNPRHDAAEVPSFEGLLQVREPTIQVSTYNFDDSASLLPEIY